MYKNPSLPLYTQSRCLLFR